jgi:hypothetical protein
MAMTTTWYRSATSPGWQRRRVRARVGDLDAAPVETLVIAGGQHSWLYEDARYRAEVARFLAAHLEGSLAPLHAASLAAATPAERVPAARSGYPRSTRFPVASGRS